MKLSLATYFLVNFFLTLKCPYTDASEIRTRRPKKIRDAKPLPITEILQKCKNLKQPCSPPKKKCCDGLTCKIKEGNTKGKCAGEPKYFKLQQEMLLQYSGGNIRAVSMSHGGNTVLVQGKDKSQTHILSGLFQSPVLVPGFSEMIIHQEFFPKWTNCVSGDGNVIAISDYDTRIVQVYKLTTDSDINGNGWHLLGEEINGNNLGGSLDWENFGSSLALSFNGDTLIVGADYAGDDYKGALQRFEFIEDAWKSIGDRIDGEHENDQIGRFPLQMSKDTSRILVGGGRNGFASVYDWEEEQEQWNLEWRFVFECKGWTGCVCDRTWPSCFDEESGDQYPYFGQEVNFLSSDGNIVAIGDHNYDPTRKTGVKSEGAQSGAIHFFQWKKKSEEFVEFAQKLVGPKKAELGWTFGMSDNGKTLVSGNYDKGEVYHYKLKVGKKYVKYATIATGGFSKIFLSGDGTKLTVTSTKSDDQVDTYTLE